YKSTDHGQTFTAVAYGLPSTLVFDLTFNDDESLIFAATEVGPYVYVVADNQWYPIRGLSAPDQLYWDVEYIAATNTVRYATYGRGIWDFKMQSTGSNQAPLVSITSPANNATFTAPATVNITATASDPDGSVSKVEFYNGSQYLGEDTSSPYTYSWTNVSAGNYTITAKVYDNLNLSSTSSPVNISVSEGSTCTAAEWSPSEVYVYGHVVQYNGVKYFANYWNLNQRPDLFNGGPGSGQPWTSQGTCTSRISNSSAETLTMVPNPVDNSSIVSLNLDESDVIELYVIDQIGRRVAELFKGSVSAGNHNFDLNSSSFNSGVYTLIMKGEKGNISLRFIKK
ncbi:MAG TPA: Ig-like domain-containing protein, partial [Cytophagaceae bacterium]